MIRLLTRLVAVAPGTLSPLLPMPSHGAIPDRLTLESATTKYICGGEYITVTDPVVTVSTVLGSCVSACIFDPLTGFGGMNHFVLPERNNMQDAGPKERYGEYAMRALVDELCALGAKKSRLQATLFGGARMLHAGANIGRMNSEFAEAFLRTEGIRIVGGSLGGEAGRRVKFHPSTGKASLATVRNLEPEAIWPQLVAAPVIVPLGPIRIDRPCSST